MHDRYPDELPDMDAPLEWDCEIDDSPEVMRAYWIILMYGGMNG